MKQQFEQGHVPVPDNTVGAIFGYGIAELSQLYGREEASAMIAALLEHYAGIPLSATRASFMLRLQQSELIRVYNALVRLKAGEPLQYITGQAFFYHSDFQVSPAVLIPRPETEELVHLIITENRERIAPVVLDIGTGSGCIAISLARFLPGARVHAADISAEALAMARANAGNLQADVCFHQVDILDAGNHPQLPAADIIVSNPPYISRSEAAAMPENVTAHEPHTALFVPDDDPLVFYKVIATLGKTHLLPGGCIYAEISEWQGAATVTVFREAGYARAELLQDLSGKDRFVRVSA